MTFAVISLSGLLLAVAMQDRPEAAYAVPQGACEIRPDAPYVNPRLPLGRAAWSRRPACRTTWADGPGGPALYVQGSPIRVDGPPVHVGGLQIYLVPPEIIVAPSPVTVEPPRVQLVPAPEPAPGED